VSAFVQRLGEQVEDAFAASQQYLAMGVHYRVALLPRLACVCYDRAVEHRDRALEMVGYLVDAGMPATVPGVPAPETTFADTLAPLEFAVARERRMCDRAGELVRLARDAGDHGSEQFVKRLIGEQSQALTSLLSLVRVVRRSPADPYRAEEFLAAGDRQRGRFTREHPAELLLA
jgi:ferritin